MGEDVSKIKAFILEGLIKTGKFGGAHTPLGNVIRHLPDGFLRDKKGRKVVDEAVKELANLGWVKVQKKRTGKGSDLHISINPRTVKEIHSFLRLPH
jgi:hypothetical protein